MDTADLRAHRAPSGRTRDASERPRLLEALDGKPDSEYVLRLDVATGEPALRRSGAASCQALDKGNF